MKSGLRGDPDAHWNLILPQIICYIVVLKVLKLSMESSPAYLILNFALSLLQNGISLSLPAEAVDLMGHVSVTR